MVSDNGIARRRAFLLDLYRPLIDASRPVALVDFQDSKNAGDHAIWLGTKALLREFGVRVVYECSSEDYDREAMAAALGDGTVLIQGGGNFGDIYGDYQQFKLGLFAAFPDNPILMFPQTVMFYTDAAIARAVAAVEKHGRVTLSARDVRSEHQLRNTFGHCAKIVYGPDMACMLGSLQRMGAPRFDIVWIAREDEESVRKDQVIPAELQPTLRKIRRTDIAPDIPIRIDAGILPGQEMATDWYRVVLEGKGAHDAYDQLSFDERAGLWLRCAMALISNGRVVITDRLHGHILCTLAGIPHVLIDNSYGKNLAYFEAWSRPSSLCRLARKFDHARDVARELLAETAAKA